MKAVMILLLVSVLSGYCLAVIPISAGDKPVKLAPKRTAQLKAAAKSFRLNLLYHGDQEKFRTQLVSSHFRLSKQCRRIVSRVLRGCRCHRLP